VRRPERLALHSLLYAAGCMLALVPFTPGISDIRKAKTEQPAQLMSADGKLLAEYRWANREWVALDRDFPPWWTRSSPPRTTVSTSHWGLDWRRTASSVVLHAAGRQAGRLHHHAAAGAQPVPRGNRPLAHRSRASSRRRSRR
jgi:penicillin-binding protein 1A